MLLNYKNPLIIYNPFAGGGRAKKKFDNYYKKLIDEKLFERIDVCETKSKDDAISKVEEIVKTDKFDLLISIGGDGTISTIINGLMKVAFEKRIPLFPLPSGSGDSLLRDHNIKNIESSINIYKNSESPKLYDVLHLKQTNSVYEWYCINVLGMGFISDIASYAVEHGKKLGALSYITALFMALGKFKPYNTTIKYNDNDQYKSEKVYFMTISNTKYTGGALKIAPDAKYDDGLMDVVILHDINRFQFLKGFLKVFFEKHLTDKGCYHFQTDKLEIKASPNFSLMPDGDLEGSSPVSVNLLHKQISLVV